MTWEDELILRGTLDDIAARARGAGLTKQAIILVGPALDPELRRLAVDHRSKLYDPAYSHSFRLAEGRGQRRGDWGSDGEP